ncbi:MAG TPA: MurR/RpiR family transcriptional regulator [Jatrophihabitantaceae bacterium]|jgi:DNA-binding MurR/RpiR family transcriptional regulator
MSATAKSAGATLDERVAARLEDLSAAERRVARYLADSKAEVAFASAETLGRLTETSDATVIRTVKALGYSGLPALKRTLQEGIRERLRPAGRLGRSLDKVGSDPQTVLARVLAESVELLEEAQRTIDPDAFAKTVELISGARETVVVAAGGLGVLGDYLRLRLVRTGRSARTAFASGYLLADDLLRLNDRDVMVMIAHQFLVRELDVALDRANEVGAKVVLVTDALGDALADRVTVSVSGPIGDTDMFSVQATTLAILDSIALAVSAHDRQDALDALEEMNRMRKELRGEDASGASSRRRRRNGRAAAK